MSTFANSGDPDEMQHNAAFPRCLHVILTHLGNRANAKKNMLYQTI